MLRWFFSERSVEGSCPRALAVPLKLPVSAECPAGSRSGIKHWDFIGGNMMKSVITRGHGPHGDINDIMETSRASSKKSNTPQRVMTNNYASLLQGIHHFTSEMG